MMWRRALAALVPAAVCGLAHAQMCSPVQISTAATGGAEKVVERSGTAYVASGNGGAVFVVDVSDPSMPSIVRSVTYPFAEVCNDVVLNGDAMYAVDPNSGLIVFDVSAPRDPTFVTRVSTPVDARASLDGDTLYVTTDSGIKVFDVTNALAPVVAGSINVNSYTFDVAVADGLAYLATFDNLFVVDVSDPGNLSVVSTLDLPGQSLCIALNGTVAYLGGSGPSSVIYAVDISDPAHPALVSSVSSPGEHSALRVEGDRLFSAARATGLRVLDIADPTAPVEIGHYNTAGEARGTFVDYPMVYVADNTGGLRVINIDTCGLCETDLTLDGATDFFDVQLFLSLFASSDPTADWNGDGLWDFFDVQQYLGDVAAGCG